MKKIIYVAIDNVADGPMEIDDKKTLLSEIKRKYPKAISAEPHGDKDSQVIIVSTKKKK